MARIGAKAPLIFGAARGDWERRHGTAAEQIAVWLPSLPGACAGTPYLHKTGAGPYTGDTVPAAVTDVGNALGHPVEKLPDAAE